MALVVFTGGARSGKSAAAQRLAKVRHTDGVPVVVAVFARGDDGDPEMAARIERHQSDRPAGFATIEATDATMAWLADVPADALLVVDCLGTLLGLAIEDAWCEHAGEALADAGGDLDPELAADAQERAERIVSAIAGREGDTIVVTNEVGMAVVPEYASGRLFRDLLGWANAALVREADAAYLAVAGRLLDLSAAPKDARWPED